MARILVAGKDATEAKAHALLIEFAGHKCVTAGSLKEALETVENAPIDLVIADIELLSGYPSRTAEMIRRCSARAALMVLTDNADTPVAADAVVLSPCSPEEFFRGIDHALGKFQKYVGTSATVDMLYTNCKNGLNSDKER